MVGLHVQSGVSNWLTAVAKLPANTWVKVFSEQQGAEIKAANPGCKVVRRHHYDEGQVFGGTYEENKQRARVFFNSFVNDTFIQYAQYIDAIEGWNEYLANGQSQQEVDDRIRWVQASQEVWRTEYRTNAALAHIRLVSANAAIGNDIPWQMAKAAQDNGGILGYHSYVPVNRNISIYSTDGQPLEYIASTRERFRIGTDGKIAPSFRFDIKGNYAITQPFRIEGQEAADNYGILANEWNYYSGRWTVMDADYRARGITVNWLFTEGGEVGYDQCGNGICLNPVGGWRNSEICGGDVDLLNGIIGYWMDRTKAWNATHDGRALSVVLFTTGGGSQWQSFEKKQPELDVIAQYVKDHTVTIPPPLPYLPGVDISHHQGAVNWQTMATSQAKYLFIRATYGTTLDTRFYDNWDNAKVNNIPRGAYHYYRNNFGGIEQAQAFTSALGGDWGELPCVVDCEDTQGTVNATEMLLCLQEIERISGRKPIIYTGAWWWNPRIGNVAWAKDYDLWVANYGVTVPALPLGWFTWKFWQYSSSGVGAEYGVASERIDLDYFNGTQADFDAYITPPFTWNKLVYLFPHGVYWHKIQPILKDEAVAGRHDITFSVDSAFAPQAKVDNHKVIVYKASAWGGRPALEAYVMETYGRLPDEIEYRQLPA